MQRTATGLVIGLLVGPVWFNDRGLNGRMKWTAQTDITF